MRFSTSGFFHESLSPRPPSIPLGPFEFFAKIRGDIRKCMLIAGDNDTGEQLLPLTTTLVINLLPVTRTRKPWRWGAAKDRRKLKGTN
jgi:hypothetical protein